LTASEDESEYGGGSGEDDTGSIPARGFKDFNTGYAEIEHLKKEISVEECASKLKESNNMFVQVSTV